MPLPIVAASNTLTAFEIRHYVCQHRLQHAYLEESVGVTSDVRCNCMALVECPVVKHAVASTSETASVALWLFKRPNLPHIH